MERVDTRLQDEEDHAQSSRSKKRRRTVQACEECRDRKRKCDGMRPVCGSCSRRPDRCIWNDDRNTKGWTNNYVESLQSRIRELESSQGLLSSLQGADEPDSMQHPQQSPPGEENIEVDFSVSDDAIDHADSNIDTGDTHDQRNKSPSRHQIHSASSAAPPPAPPVPLSESTETQPQMQSPPVAYLASQNSKPFGRSLGSAVEEGDSSDDSSDQGDFEPERSNGFVDGLDAMGVVHSASDGAIGRPRRPSGYFGPSSTVSLLGDAFSAIKQRIYKNGPSSSVSRDSAVGDLHDDVFQYQGASGRQKSSPLARNDSRAETSLRRMGYTIPPRAEADKLVDSYWTWVHSLYPFTHMPSFLARYRSIWESSNQVRDTGTDESQGGNPTNYYDAASEKLFHCLLNVVFAMGALFNPDIAPQGRNAVSRTFFNRAKALVDLDELACGSIILVQILLLMGQYLQSTDAASSCWNIVGLAIRVCQGIGLHREPDCCRGESCTRKEHSQLDREIRRRTWACSIILDRVLSLTYGRPMMIHPAMTQSRLCLPAAIDDEFLTGPGQPPGQQPAGTISIIGCYIQSVRLQEIISKFIFPVNHAPFESQQATKTRQSENAAWYENEKLDMNMILDIENLFDDWRRNLPAHLRIQSYKNGQGLGLMQTPTRLMLLERQANVLSTRFLHARLTLFRPALTVLCQAPSEADNANFDDKRTSSIKQEMVVRAANSCLSATDALVDLMTSSTDHQTDRLPAPWYNVFYIHSCAMVLLLGYLCTPTYITCMSKESLTIAYNRCVTFLRAYGPISRSARRSSKVLTIIQHEVFQQNNETDNSSRTKRPVATAINGYPDIPPIDAGDLQYLMPLCDPAQSQSMMDSHFSGSDNLNQDNLGWIGDANDMNWLSMVPFWGDVPDNTIV